MISTGLGALKGLLISGGSGSGKSAILKQLQDIFRKSDRRVTFKTIWSTQLLSRVVGGAEEYVHKLFEELREQ